MPAIGKDNKYDSLVANCGCDSSRSATMNVKPFIDGVVDEGIDLVEPGAVAWGNVKPMYLSNAAFKVA